VGTVAALAVATPVETTVAVTVATEEIANARQSNR